jgi:glycosyltransferase involved in cell wall biosynthesis
MTRASSKSLRVRILTPGQIGCNPRVVKEADALHAAGHQVEVIATRIVDRVEPRDQALMRRARWRLQRIDLRARTLWRARRVLQIAARGLHGATGQPRFADFGFSAYTWPIWSAALKSPADLYIAHYPPALPAAALAARRHGAAYAYDAEDYHLGDWPADPVFDMDRHLVRSIESRYLPGAAYLSAASPGIAQAYAEAYGIERPRVVLNAFPLSQAPAAPSPRGVARPGPSLYWFSQTIGPNRGLECAVRAIGKARSRPHLYLRGWLAPGMKETLDRIAGDAGVLDHVHILDTEEPGKMVALAADYDIGLCGEPAYTCMNDLAVTNKLLTFILAGLPPLMSTTSGQAGFAAETGLGDYLYPIDDHDALARLLDLVLENPDRLASLRARAWRLGQERYNWDHESASLIDLVSRSVDA